jgi:hypothetical protein
VKTLLKPYMFWLLLYDHPQGPSFVLSALPLLRLFALSSCLFGMWLYVVYVCVCVCVPGVPVPVCGMSGRSRPDIPQTDSTSGTHTHIDNIQPHTE